jgi:transcriptional antiterminator RfaH
MEYSSNFHVLRCMTGSETVVSNLVQRDIGLETLAPLGTVKNMHHGRPQMVQRPIFPGYVFARYQDPSQRSDVIRHIPYVIEWLRFGNFEATVTADEISRVQLMLSIGAECSGRPHLTPGQRVRVIAGSFTDLEGEFVREKGQGFLVVNLEMFNRSVVTKIEWANVEPIRGKKISAAA